jgi:hypothetical protein
MRAVLKGNVVAESDDIVECHGYHYFPGAAVRTEWLEKTERTADDLECPHGVQFYDVVIDGARHPAPLGSMRRRGPRWRRPADASASGRTSRSTDPGYKRPAPAA